MEVDIRTRARPSLRSYKALLLAAGVLLLLLFIYLSLNALITPALLTYAETRIQSIATDAIYGGIYTAMDAAEEPFVNIMQTDGEVHYIEMNSRALSILASNIAADVQNYLNAIGEQGIAIPLGTISGIPLFAGHGPDILLKFMPEGTSQVEFYSEFLSAGINQSLHRVHMVVCTDVALALPRISKIVSTRVEMTVAEHVVVGKVPDAYAAGGSGILNLAPAS